MRKLKIRTLEARVGGVGTVIPWMQDPSSECNLEERRDCHPVCTDWSSQCCCTVRCRNGDTQWYCTEGGCPDGGACP
jgi:hypothetical protein